MGWKEAPCYSLLQRANIGCSAAPSFLTKIKQQWDYSLFWGRGTASRCFLRSWTRGELMSFTCVGQVLLRFKSEFCLSPKPWEEGLSQPWHARTEIESEHAGFLPRKTCNLLYQRNLVMFCGNADSISWGLAFWGLLTFSTCRSIRRPTRPDLGELLWSRRWSWRAVAEEPWLLLHQFHRSQLCWESWFFWFVKILACSVICA